MGVCMGIFISVSKDISILTAIELTYVALEKRIMKTSHIRP